MTSPSLLAAVQKAQNFFIEQDPFLRRHCANAPVSKAHIAVLATTVQEKDLDEVRELIETTLRDKTAINLPEQFLVEVQGVDAFGDKVVFAGVNQGAKMLRLLHKQLVTTLEKAGFVCDSRYSPHLALMKVRSCCESSRNDSL